MSMSDDVCELFPFKTTEEQSDDVEIVSNE